MNALQRWLQAPQTHWFRKLLFQVHLWTGIGFGLYVLVISLSGSALLLKSPFYGWFEPKYIDVEQYAGMQPLEGEALQARMREVYAGYGVGFTIEAFSPGDATYVVIEKDGVYDPHYFNQYTGEDLGSGRPWPIRAVEGLANVHDDLLLGRTGRRWNGAGGALFVLMSVTGLVIWWRGRTRWYEGLMIRRGANRPLLWQLHSFVGFWTLLLMLAWGVSGFQLGFPQVMSDLVAWLDSDPADGARPDGWLQFFRNLHFASYGEGVLVQWAWIAATLLPALLFVTGLILWWRRVVMRWLRGAGARTSSAA